MNSSRLHLGSSNTFRTLLFVGFLVAGLLYASAATAQDVTFYTDQNQLQSAVMYNGFDGGEGGVSMRTFDLTASNVGLAQGVPGTPVDNQNLCPQQQRGEAGCSLTWTNAATGFGVDVTLRALENGAALIWNDQGGSGFNADGISIGAINTHLDDDFVVEWGGDSVYGFGLVWADNNPVAGEMLMVYDTSDQLIASYDLSSFGANDDGGAFIGALSDVAIGYLLIDDDPLADDTFLRSITAVTSAIEVTTFDDWTPFIRSTNDDGQCSLREALIAARDNVPVDSCRAGSSIPGVPIREPGPQSLDFIHMPAGTYLLEYGPVVIDSLVMIMGDGMDATYIDAQEQFSVIDNQHSNELNRANEPERGRGMSEFGFTATLMDLTIQNGYNYYGGGVLNHGSLTLYRTRVSNNTAEMGGGIYNPDPNYYRFPGDYRLYIYESVIEDNLAKISEDFLRAPELPGPRAQGGGIYSASYLDMYATTVRNNRVEGGDDAFSSYQAEGGGAWIGGDYESAYISQSTFSGNVAKASSFINDTFARGGGLFFSSMYQYMDNSTISGNEALGERTSLGVGGGIFAEFVDGCGGGARCRGKVVDVAVFANFLTVTDNEASFAAGGLIGDLGLANSIVVSNEAALEENCGVSTGLQSGGANMYESGETQCPTDESDVFVTPPETYLGDLADNGGPVLTHRLLEGSPAVNAGQSDYRSEYGCYEYYDGRGFSRMYSGGCDIGSYEVGENAFFDYSFEGSSVPGEQASFEIDVTNPGYYDLTVDISALFPEELENCTWTCTMDEWYDEYDRGGPTVCTPGPSSGDISDAGISLGGGTIASYDVTCDIRSDAIDDVEVPTEVAVTEGFDPVEDDNMDSFSLTPTPMADVEIAVEWDAPPTGLGLWTVTVSVTNNGPSDAANLTVREDSALNLLLDDWDCGNGAQPIRTNATLCQFASLPSGVTETMSVTFDVTGLPGEAAESTFTVYLATSDPNGDNNSFEITELIAPVFESGFEKETPETEDFLEWSAVVVDTVEELARR